MSKPLAAFCALALLFSGCSSTRGSSAFDSEPGLYPDLGTWTRPIGASSPEAQRWFDQGLVLAYAFNHDEAIRCFREAARLDPANPMPWWGIALASGPHYNNPVVAPERSRAALEALAEARERIGHARPVERALIEAQSLRFAEPPPDAPAASPPDRRPLDERYAAAMRGVLASFPDDPDVAALTAESLMNLQPWDLWTKEGEPKGSTTEILAILERTLASAPQSPGANHLYVHVVEASPHAEKGRPSADRLRTLVPDAGHLVHMPAHIDIRLGDYAKAAETNERAIQADERFGSWFPKDGFYRVYMAHNPHFLAFACMLDGRRERALEAARLMVASVPREFVEGTPAAIDGILPVVLHAQVRFGMWDEILREPPFPKTLVAANATRHYARGVALTALGRTDEAERELAELRRLTDSLDDRLVGINPAKNVLPIAVHTLEGELAFRRGERDRAIESLREAVALEDALLYMEPPDWMMPVRHPYGAMLLEAERWSEAEQAFREDLRRFPENGWSLYGLARALRAQGREADARDVEARFRKAWARADVELRSSCFCQPGSGPAVVAMR